MQIIEALRETVHAVADALALLTDEIERASTDEALRHRGTFGLDDEGRNIDLVDRMRLLQE